MEIVSVLSMKICCPIVHNYYVADFQLLAALVAKVSL